MNGYIRNLARLVFHRDLVLDSTLTSKRSFYGSIVVFFFFHCYTTRRTKRLVMILTMDGENEYYFNRQSSHSFSRLRHHQKIQKLTREQKTTSSPPFHD
jgi:hypothetical protein